MSLVFRNGVGIETPMAGLNGTSGELVPSVSYYQQGQSETTSIEANVGKPITITFSTPMPDGDYVVALGNFAEYCYFSINEKSASGFKVYVKAATTSSNFRFSWQAFKLMTDEQTALDEQAIADIQAVIPSTATSANKLITASELEEAINSIGAIIAG